MSSSKNDVKYFIMGNRERMRRVSFEKSIEISKLGIFEFLTSLGSQIERKCRKYYLFGSMYVNVQRDISSWTRRNNKKGKERGT